MADFEDNQWTVNLLHEVDMLLGPNVDFTVKKEWCIQQCERKFGKNVPLSVLQLIDSNWQTMPTQDTEMSVDKDNLEEKKEEVVEIKEEKQEEVVTKPKRANSLKSSVNKKRKSTDTDSFSPSKSRSG